MTKTNKIIKYIVLFEIIYTILINAICDYFSLPRIIKYVPDALNIILLFFILFNYKKILQNKSLKIISIVVGLFLFFSLIGYLINGYSLYIYLWGLRKYTRFIIMFFSVYLLFEKEDIEKFYKNINILFIVNVILILCQYFVFGDKMDYIGGTFAFSTIGGNVSLIPFLVLVLFMLLSKFEFSKINIVHLIVYVALILFIAAIAELKIMYILFILSLIVLFFVNNNKSSKKIIFAAVSIIIIISSVFLLTTIYPEWKNSFNYNKIVENIMGNDEMGYSSKTDLSRGKAIIQINERVFKKSYVKYFFGYGLGNCDNSSIDRFTSKFYKKYGNTLHHTFFMHSLYYLETGGIGLILYCLFYLLILIYTFKLFRNCYDNSNKELLFISLLCCIVSPIFIIYNEFLKLDTSYFWFAVLSFPFIIEKDRCNNEKK